MCVLVGICIQDSVYEMFLVPLYNVSASWRTVGMHDSIGHAFDSRLVLDVGLVAQR